MRKLRIVSDSSSDILELKNVDFAYAPMKIITAEREFTDDSHLDVDEIIIYKYDFFFKPFALLGTSIIAIAAVVVNGIFNGFYPPDFYQCLL